MKHHDNTILNTIQYRDNNTHNTTQQRERVINQNPVFIFCFLVLFEKMVFMVFSRRRAMMFLSCCHGVYGVREVP